MRNELVAFLDWENIRKALQDEFVERVEVDEVMDAVSGVAKEINVTLAQATFYSDFTLRRDEARKIQGKPRFEAKNVLRSATQRDRSDAVIIADIMELTHDPNSAERILLCAADSGYCDVVRRCDSAGRRIYTCAVSTQMSQELAGLAPFYPLEKYLPRQLRRRSSAEQALAQPQLPPRDLARWSKLIGVLDSLEKRLPAVHLNYFLRTIMLSYRLGGLTDDDRYAYLETARERGIVVYEEADDARRPGQKVQAVRLNREHDLVKEILSRK